MTWAVAAWSVVKVTVAVVAAGTTCTLPITGAWVCGLVLKTVSPVVARLPPASTEEATKW